MTIIQTILVPFQSLSISKMPRLIADDPRGQETLSAAERFQLRPRHRRPHRQRVQVLLQRYIHIIDIFGSKQNGPQCGQS